MQNYSLPLLIMSMIIPMSCSNMLIIWISLELNTMVFIFLLKSSGESENLMKYFLVQEVASMIMISSIVMYSTSKSNEMFPPMLISSLIVLSMLIKLGACPFHHWVVQIGMSMKIEYLPLLLSIQKVAPLFIMTSNSSLMLTLISTLMSGLMGSIGQLIINKIKSLLVMSSITHLSWMMLSSFVSKKTTIIYISVYSLIMFNLVNEIKMSSIHSPLVDSEMNFTLTMLMFSMGGLPPMVGFAPKLTIIHSALASNEIMIVLFMLTMFSVISMISYLRMTFKSILKSIKLSLLMKKYKTSNKMMWQLMLLPMMLITVQTF